MVTRDRPGKAIRAIDMYMKQTWPRKELIIVVDTRGKGLKEIEDYVAKIKRTDVKLFSPPPVTDSFVRLRNFSINHSDGDFICNWDDDDLYHPKRVEIQLQDIMRKKAEVSFFGDFLYLFEDVKELSWVHYPWCGGHPGTIMCKRSINPQYPIVLEEREEDSKLQTHLKMSGAKITSLCGNGYLYVYVFHGKNVWDREHHSKLLQKRISSIEFVRPRIQELKSHLPALGITIPDINCREGKIPIQ